MKINDVLQSFHDRGCRKVLVKKLSTNDNSKNQVYIGGEKALQYLPFQNSELVKVTSKKSKTAEYIFRNALNFHWLTETGVHSAPEAKVIFYPQYPESRFSGFLKGCKGSPSKIIGPRLENRFLILSFNNKGESFGYVNFINDDFNSFIEKNFYDSKDEVFFESSIQVLINKKEKHSLNNSVDEIKKYIASICAKGWIKAKKFDKDGKIVPHKAVNAGGVTLETELGIRANSKADPDYLGWEIKQHSGRPVTLFTPEPDAGFYKEKGIAEFIKSYGYPDQKGKKDRFNFGGVHRVSDEKHHHLTNLKLIIHGFEKGSFTKSDGHIGLMNKKGETVAMWSFTKLLLHWQKKHFRTCFIKSERKEKNGDYYFKYSPEIELGIESSFSNFLTALEEGIAYYDPGSKLYKEDGKWKTKARSQFRIKEKDLDQLYKKYLRVCL